MVDAQHFQWIKKDRYGAFTIAVVNGLSEGRLIEIYGGDPASSTACTFEQSVGMAHGDDDFYVHTLTVDGLVVAIENNGWTGSVAEIARRTSVDGGRFLSVYWNAAIVNFTLIYAVNGVVEGWHNNRSCGQDKRPASVPEWDEAIYSDGQPIAPSLALIERNTGVAVREEWFTTPQRTTRIPDVDNLLPQVALGKNVSGGEIIQSDPDAWKP